MNKSALIIGWFGQNNVGDDILLTNAIAVSERHLSIEKFTIFVTHRYTDRAITANLKQVEAKSNIKGYYILRHLIEIARNEYLIFGGGSFFVQNNSRDMLNLIFTYIFTIFAKLIGKRVIILAASLGPTNSKIARVLVKKIASTASLIILRDASSKDYLVPKKNDQIICQSHDPAPGIVRNIFRIPMTRQDSQRYVIGVSLSASLSSIDQNSVIKCVCIAINQVYVQLRSPKVVVFLIQMCSNESSNDIQYLERIADQLNRDIEIRILNYDQDTKAFLTRFCEMNIVICQRLHSAICSYALGLKFLPIESSKKMSEFSNDIGKTLKVRNDYIYDVNEYVKNILALTNRSDISSLKPVDKFVAEEELAISDAFRDMKRLF